MSKVAVPPNGYSLGCTSFGLDSGRASKCLQIEKRLLSSVERPVSSEGADLVESVFKIVVPYQNRLFIVISALLGFSFGFGKEMENY